MNVAQDRVHSRLCEYLVNIRVYKGQGTSWLSEWLLGSQGLSCMEKLKNTVTRYCPFRHKTGKVKSVPEYAHAFFGDNEFRMFLGETEIYISTRNRIWRYHQCHQYGIELDLGLPVNIRFIHCPLSTYHHIKYILFTCNLNCICFLHFSPVYKCMF
jgi:hypothetical protein